jgi:hypothetical protein
MRLSDKSQKYSAQPDTENDMVPTERCLSPVLCCRVKVIHLLVIYLFLNFISLATTLNYLKIRKINREKYRDENTGERGVCCARHYTSLLQRGGQKGLLSWRFPGSTRSSFFQKYYRLRVTLIVFSDTFRTTQETHSVSVIKTSQLMLRREIIAVCSEIHTEHINTLCGRNVDLLRLNLAVHKVIIGF